MGNERHFGESFDSWIERLNREQRAKQASGCLASLGCLAVVGACIAGIVALVHFW